MDASGLPNRRVEAWKYTDLRAALADQSPPLRDGRDIIERLAPETQRMAIASGEERFVIERMESSGFAARAVEIDLEPGAAMTRVVIQSGAGQELSMARVTLAKGARYRQFILAEGGKLVRIETHIVVVGEGAEVELNGAYLCAGGRHADLTSVITHRAARAQTRQLVKGVARKGGRAVFQGKIVVERAAQKTDARQHHQALMLEDGADIFAKPELMIFADDVQCAHGNTVGGLDAGALFYLRSRGIPEAQARALLIEAFLAEAIPANLPSDTHDELTVRMRNWLAVAP